MGRVYMSKYHCKDLLYLIFSYFLYVRSDQ